MKTGMLATGGEIEPSLAWELVESKGDTWLTRGWSLDVITTRERGGLGVAKDLHKSELLEVDLGGYVTQDYEDLFGGRYAPKFGVGLNVAF